jgi:hypothetical protein
MIAMCLDPQTTSGTGILLADHEVIWEYVFDDLVDFALQIGPPLAFAAPGPVPPFPGQEQHLAEGRHQNDNLGYAHDVEDFLHELDENVNKHGHIDDKDDLQELIDANDDPDNVIGDTAEHWSHETGGGMIHNEIDFYKYTKGLKLPDPETVKFWIGGASINFTFHTW